MTTHFPVRTALLVVAAIGALALVPIVARDALTDADNSAIVSGATAAPSRAPRLTTFARFSSSPET